MRSIGLLALVLTLAPAAQSEPLGVFRDCDVCPEMIELPMGSFVMGAPADEFRHNAVFLNGRLQRATPDHPYVKDDEGPQHEVTIDVPFAMSRHEITFGEWRACVDDGGCDGYVPDSHVMIRGSSRALSRTMEIVGSDRKIINGYTFLRSDDPVINISFQDAITYVAWLNLKSGTNAYRLPTEAEWEYAARAGTTTRFAQGDELSSERANFSGAATEIVLFELRPDLLTRGLPVLVNDLDAANAWGLRHMSGNVSEWTLSCYSRRYNGWSTASEWLERSPADSCIRAIRGGSYFGPMDNSRSAWRLPQDETTRTTLIGFRVIKDLTTD